MGSWMLNNVRLTPLNLARKGCGTIQKCINLHVTLPTRLWSRVCCRLRAVLYNRGLLQPLLSLKAVDFVHHKQPWWILKGFGSSKLFNQTEILSSSLEGYLNPWPDGEVSLPTKSRGCSPVVHNRSAPLVGKGPSGVLRLCHGVWSCRALNRAQTRKSTFHACE